MSLRIFHVVGVLAGNALALHDEADEIGSIEPPRILRMAAVRDIAQGSDDPPVGEPRTNQDFTVDECHLLTGAEIGAGRFRGGAFDPKGDAFAGAAAIEPEHETWTILRPAMHMGIDAQRTMIAADESPLALREREARPPHQRPIGEHPKIIGTSHRYLIPTRRQGKRSSSIMKPRTCSPRPRSEDAEERAKEIRRLIRSREE